MNRNKSRMNLALWIRRFSIFPIFVIFVIFPIFECFNLQAQTFQNNFVHFSQKDGLPSDNVHSLIQDHLGYIWIGTSNGLTRYDGYDFYNFSIVNKDSNFLQLPLTTTLYEDFKGNIWIGSVGGITKYDRVKETFKLYDASLFGILEQKEFVINSIQETLGGDLLLGVRGFYYNNIKRGLFVIKKDSDKIEYIDLAGEDSTNAILQIYPRENDKYLICGFRGLGEYNHLDKSVSWFPIENGSAVTSMLLDENNKVWLSIHNEGIYNYNLSDSTFKSIPIIKRTELTNGSFYSMDMCYDQNNNIILASNYGLIQFNRADNSITYADYDLHNPTALHSYRISQIMRDNTGIFWIGFEDVGISKYNPIKNRFKSYNHMTNDSKSITPGWVSVIFEFSKNELWFKSESDKISIFNKETEEFNNLEIPSNSSIESIIRDRNDQIWAAGYNTFYKVDPDKWVFETVDTPLDLEQLVIHVLFEDSKNTFWIGAHGGLYNFDRENNVIAKIDFEALGLGTSSSNSIFQIVEDKNKNIWIGTDNGLFKFNQTDKQYSRIGLSKDSSKTLNSQDVNSLYADELGTIWVGTWRGGLNKFDTKTGKIKSYTTKEGLKTHSVHGILGDEKIGRASCRERV